MYVDVVDVTFTYKYIIIFVLLAEGVSSYLQIFFTRAGILGRWSSGMRDVCIASGS